VYGPVLKTITQLSARAQNHSSPERCRKSFTISFLGDHDFPLTGSNFRNLTAFRAIFSQIFTAHAHKRPMSHSSVSREKLNQYWLLQTCHRSSSGRHAYAGYHWLVKDMRQLLLPHIRYKPDHCCSCPKWILRIVSWLPVTVQQIVDLSTSVT